MKHCSMAISIMGHVRSVTLDATRDWQTAAWIASITEHIVATREALRPPSANPHADRAVSGVAPARRDPSSRADEIFQPARFVCGSRQANYRMASHEG